jgi:hypothetical protein
MNDAPRTIPHYINEDNSEMRGIKPGWYAIDEGGRARGPNQFCSLTRKNTIMSKSDM